MRGVRGSTRPSRTSSCAVDDRAVKMQRTTEEREMLCPAPVEGPAYVAPTAVRSSVGPVPGPRRPNARPADGRGGAARQVRRTARGVGVWILAVLPCLAPAPAASQTVQQILTVMQQGGTWLSLPIVEGKGSYLGTAVPTLGLALKGWFQVADVHRGEWTIKVVDLAKGGGTSVVDARVAPGQRVPVAYEAGPTVRMRVDVTWSEPADTVLWVWVGVQRGEDGSEP